MEFRALDNEIYQLLVESLNNNEIPDQALKMLETYQSQLQNIVVDNEVIVPIAKPISQENAENLLDAEDQPSCNTPYATKVNELLNLNSQYFNLQTQAEGAISPSLLLVAAAAASCPQDEQNQELIQIFGEQAGSNFDVYSTMHEVLGSIDGAVEFTEFTRYQCGHIIPDSVVGDCPICQRGRDNVYKIVPKSSK
ncbi:hypothetical protein SS50377_26595 [Spironucleus salmonicida]|uniref:Uncharacterized protein n=1 Tax=Spironucleus salmonicida TaxID=348837 RepID=V6LAK9_9EUKA|nr:hypothetical protein SS50377_26595 [Spironucleus salmonicida]|eukprot:EST41447.1 Hypothetical protein SS50377_19165 [Spironucleus salmonicida]